MISLAILSDHHNRLFSLVSSQEFGDALNAIDDDSGARDEADRDVRAFLTNKGMTIDPDISIIFKKGSWSVCLNLGIISFCYSK
jgi:hypothetical protein